MDEMMADLSTAVDKLSVIKSEEGEAVVLDLFSRLSQKNRRVYCDSEPRQQQISKTYVFGDDSASSAARIVEDQTGAIANIVFGGGNSEDKQGSGTNSASRSLAPTRRNVHEYHKTGSTNTEGEHHRRRHQRKTFCRKRLEMAVRLAQYICESIFNRTGFHVSAGISVSPILAKLSVIEKPKTVNLLLPWRSPDLLYFMPLRKMHEVGSRTYRALSETAFSVASNKNKKAINAENILVRDLLEVPREKIIESLLIMSQRGEASNSANIGSASNRSFCEQKCDLILQRCRGLDSTAVEDDGGGAPRTVSVENSFRRGTMTTAPAVQEAIGELCRRLPPLVQDRVGWSRQPSLAYPTTIRLTVRTMMNKDSERQREPARRIPFHVTRSKQASIGVQRGKTLLASTVRSAKTSKEVDLETIAVRTLRDSVNLLAQELIFLRDSRINITRMNLAVTDFQDVAAANLPSLSFYLAKTVRTTRDAQLKSKSGTETNEVNQTQQQTKMGRGIVLGSETNVCFSNEYSHKKRKDHKAAAASSVKPSTKRGNSAKFGCRAERAENSRKFARTRIDQFFAKK